MKKHLFILVLLGLVACGGQGELEAVDAAAAPYEAVTAGVEAVPTPKSMPNSLPTSGFIPPTEADEFYIDDIARQVIEDFLIDNYLQIFTFERVPIHVGLDLAKYPTYHLAPEEFYFHAYTFHLHDVNEDMPLIQMQLISPGPGIRRNYKFVDDEYQRVNIPYSSLVSTPMPNLREQIGESINRRLWSHRTLPCGTLVDTRLCDEAIDAVFNFFSNARPELSVLSIEKSLIYDEILRVRTWHNQHNYKVPFWLASNNNNGTLEISRYREEWGIWRLFYWCSMSPFLAYTPPNY